MIKVLKIQYDDFEGEPNEKENFVYPDLESAFKDIRNQIIELENQGKTEYWCIKNNSLVSFWDKNGNDYTTWYISEENK